jgi:uncharacterized protein YndB with AHSA1/START domain
MSEVGPAVREVSGADDVIVVEAHLSMPPDQAYGHWTEPQLLARWWAPQATFDPAGTYRYSWPDQGWELSGRVLDADPGRRLRLTWHWSHEPERPERTVEVRFEPDADGTRLQLEHGTYGADADERADRRDVADGWLHFLGRLAALDPA